MSIEESNALQCGGVVVDNRRIAANTFRIDIEAPEVADAILPGQFVMVRAADRVDPLLGRPYALYDVNADRSRLSVVYLVLGNGTRCLSTLGAGAKVELWGPLGNTFPTDVASDLLFVAGGVGQTPFLAVARELLGLQQYGRSPRKVARPRSISLAYGVRTKELLAGVEDFRNAGVEVHLATDDGSIGLRGYSTDLVRPLAAHSTNGPPTIFGCGPEPMLAKLASIAEEIGAPCWTSLEARMACGYGACFSCVCPVRVGDGDEWDYRRSCVEGPIFPAASLAWARMH